MARTDLTLFGFGKPIFNVPHDKESPRQCYHCGTTKEEGAILREAYCGYGQGLLHCEECSDQCELCEEFYCSFDLKFQDCGLHGDLLLCETCRGEPKYEDESDKNTNNN